MQLSPRLERYERFIQSKYLEGLTRGHEYDLAHVSETLVQASRAGVFRRIVFSGMGCSAIVSDVVRGYLLSQGSSLEVFVVNDYDFPHLLPASILDDPSTLIIISSYSGYSQETIRAFERVEQHRDRVLLLTSGGELARLGHASDTSVLYWRLSEPDREYPLFHVTDYFAILLSAFRMLGLVEDDRKQDLEALAQHLLGWPSGTDLELAAKVAEGCENANVVLLASPIWHDSLLKLCKMHFNEIAMVPAVRNYFHEFCHSEVATLSNPERSHAILVFRDRDDDSYTQEKQLNLMRLLAEPTPSKTVVNAYSVELRGDDFLTKFFGGLLFIQHVVLRLGHYRLVESRDLISRAAGNHWYHSTTIRQELEDSH